MAEIPLEATAGIPLDDRLYVVGVGASAGGLQALEAFFEDMPVTGKITFVVVQHLSPDHESYMPYLLSKYTDLTVSQAGDGNRLEADHIYLIPPGKNLTTTDGTLFLSDYIGRRGQNLPIDIFFESLARDQGDRAVGIILSGTGSDGTIGVRAIKEAGGVALAQDESAKFDGMPRSAIQTKLIDLIAAPGALREILLQYISFPGLGLQKAAEQALSSESEMLLQRLFTAIRNRCGVDFAAYKPSTIVRRIERRMSLRQIEDLASYVSLVETDEDECDLLYQDFLIGVTRFFRDDFPFRVLQTDVIPKLIKQANANRPIRAWVPGCSTGEEAYSIAILLYEAMEEAKGPVDFKVFATDIDGVAIETASVGRYPDSLMVDVSRERQKRFFIKTGRSYEVTRKIRSRVVFAQHDMLKDPPFSRIDLVSCRNALIYLKPDWQRRVFEAFQFSLGSGGYLLLGTSESVAGRPDFRAVDAKAKVYEYAPAGPKSASEPDPPAPAAYQRPSRPAPRRFALAEGRTGESALRAIVEHLLPPSLVIDADGTLVHAFGDVRAYMRPPTGYRLDLNVTKVVREELALTVSAAVRRTLDENDTVIYRGIVIGTGDDRRAVSLRSTPLWDPVARQRLAVVALSSADPPEPSEDEGETFQITASAQRHIATLERELQQTRESLQTTIEELETTNEELQSTNEELLAANEELQSTNEELQSVNEELLTVNGEYQEKIRELTALNDDVNNIMRSTEVGIVLLDQERRLRKFTPATQAVVNVLESDIGRPLAHLTHQFVGVDLAGLVDQVIQTLSPLERQIQTNENRTYVLRIMPYRTHTLQVEGVVMTFIEVTALEQARQAAEQAEAKIYQFVEHAPAALLMLDDEFECLHASRQWYDLFKVDGADVTGRSFFDLFPEAEQAWKPRLERALSGTIESAESDPFLLSDGQRIDLRWELRPWFEEDLDVGGVMLFASSQ